MKKQQETTYFFDEITRKDLKRIGVKGHRIYLACRNKQSYHHEPIYELAILNPDRTQALFCTEADFFSKNFINTKKLDFLEPHSLASCMDTELNILYSDEIFMARFPAIENLNFRKFKLQTISFAKLVKINSKILVQQRDYIDRKEKERAEEPIVLDDFKPDTTRTEPFMITANPKYGRSKKLGETRKEALIAQDKEILPQTGRVLNFDELNSHACEGERQGQKSSKVQYSEQAEQLEWL